MNTKNLLAVVLGKKLEAEVLEPGSYELHGTAMFAVDATVEKAAPGLYRPTTSLPLKSVLAVALRLAGVEAQHISRIVTEAAVHCMRAGQTVKLPELEVTEAALKSVESLLDKLPAKTREGATRVTGEVALAGFAASRMPALVSA